MCRKLSAHINLRLALWQIFWFLSLIRKKIFAPWYHWLLSWVSVFKIISFKAFDGYLGIWLQIISWFFNMKGSKMNHKLYVIIIGYTYLYIEHFNFWRLKHFLNQPEIFRKKQKVRRNGRESEIFGNENFRKTMGFPSCYQ